MVRLVPSMDYLKSNDILDALGVCMHTALKILICYSCGVALTVEMVAGHRKTAHPSYKACSSLLGFSIISTEIAILHFQVPSSDLEAFVTFCSDCNLYMKPEHVKLPAPGGPPVQLISKPSQGLACTASVECTYCVRDPETMQSHGRKTHARSILGEVQYRPCLVQRIFTGIRNSYFEIGQNVVPGVQPDLKATLQAKFLPSHDVPLVVAPDTERERTPLVRCMGWDKFMPDIRMNPVQRRAADAIKKKHSPEEHGGLLTRLAGAIEDHMAKASRILDGHPHKLTLSKVLLYGDAIPRDQ